jgi:hypothetical protein
MQCWSDLHCAEDLAGDLENQDNPSLQCLGIPCHSPHPPAVRATTSKGKTEGSAVFTQAALGLASNALVRMRFRFQDAATNEIRYTPFLKATLGRG